MSAFIFKHKIIAVIDIGTTAVRMCIAEVNAKGEIKQLEKLAQAVSLGHDTFTRGNISRSTAEETVNILKSFKVLLDEYKITDPKDIKSVATSAVREASNRDTFVDRIFIATGIHIEILDEAEVNRYTYLSIYPWLKSKELRDKPDILIIEVGSGSTEILVLQDQHVAFSHTFRFGAFRVREMLDDQSSASIFRSFLETQVQRIMEQISIKTALRTTPAIVAFGGDIRFAMRALVKNWEKKSLCSLPLDKLDKLEQSITELSVDDIVRKYHLPYPSAETLGPAILTYNRMARYFNGNMLYCSAISMRDGLLAELASPEEWTAEFRAQVYFSALKLGRKYNFNELHAKTTADFAQKLFHALKAEHNLPKRYEFILVVATLLHDIGFYISSRSHHKHSMYLIKNSELFGLSSKDTILTSLIARYHRKALPKREHDAYRELHKEERIAVAKLSAILRVADALDRSHSKRLQEVSIEVGEKDVIISVQGNLDIYLEQMALGWKGNLFEQVYGKNIILRNKLF